VRLTHETLGKMRAVVFGIVFALVLIAYVLHRLHL
jgi:cbb3-type cytochrome oxidase subunit 3